MKLTAHTWSSAPSRARVSCSAGMVRRRLPRVRGDVAHLYPDPPDDGVRVVGPAFGGVVTSGDLSSWYARRVDRRVLADRRTGPPHRTAALGGDRVVTTEVIGGVRQLGGEVAGVGAQARPSGHLARQRRERPVEQVASAGTYVVVAGHQIRGHHNPGLRPGGQVRPSRPLPLVVERHTLLACPVHLDVGGVHVDRRGGHRQRGPFGRRHHAQGSGEQPCVARLHPGQLLGSKPFRHAGRGGSNRQPVQPSTARSTDPPSKPSSHSLNDSRSAGATRARSHTPLACPPRRR